MKTINITEIKFDQLEKVTGGLTNAVGPVNAGIRVKAVGPVAYPYKAVGPVNYPYMKTGPLGTGPIDKPIGITDSTTGTIGSCDPIGGTGPLKYETGPLGITIT